MRTICVFGFWAMWASGCALSVDVEHTDGCDGGEVFGGVGQYGDDSDGGTDAGGGHGASGDGGLATTDAGTPGSEWSDAGDMGDPLPSLPASGVPGCVNGTFVAMPSERMVTMCGGDTLHCCHQPGLDGDHYRPVCVDLCDRHDAGTVVPMTNVSNTSVRCVDDVGQCAW